MDSTSPESDGMSNQAKAIMLTEKVKSEIKQERGSKTFNANPSIETNPFIYKGPLWTTREIVCVTFGIVVFPLRIILVTLIFLLGWSIIKLSTSFNYDEKRPIAGWRRQIQVPVAYLMRLLLFVIGFYWVETKGKPCKTSEARVVVCAPHSTVFDTMYMLYSYHFPSSISKAENKKLPFLGTALRGMQAITVERDSRENKNLAMEELAKRASLDSPQKRHVMVFPEGTCTNRSALITFKRGAFISGNPVQPVCLEWPWTGFDLSWTAGGPSRLKLAMHAMCQPYLRLKVTFLPVYVPSEDEKQNADLFASNVRAEMAKVLKVPVTSHSYEDMFLAKEARRLDISLKETFEFHELNTLYEINLDDAKRLLKRYAEVYKDNQLINGPGLAKILGIPYTKPVQELFELLKVDEGTSDEGIDFRSLLVGVTQISRALNTSNADESVELVWNAVSGGESEVSEKDLHERLSRVFNDYSKKNTKQLMKKAGIEKGDKVNYETFKKFVSSRPELLLVSLETMASRPSGGRRLSVLSQKPSQTKQEPIVAHNQ